MKNTPGDGSPELKFPRVNPSDKISLNGDNMSDLFPNRRVCHTNDHDLNMAEDILLQVDNDKTQCVDLRDNVKDNLAKLVIIHHKQKSQQSHIKKEICNRHKLPANCTDIAVPKMNKSVMTMKTFSEYQKRNDEKSFYDIL